MVKYSIIVPVYNSEKTVRHCLESIILQPCSETCEVVVVNDGSTDSSDGICRELADKYPQIKYFYKENGGVSSARNYGLSQATGKYILFADSDDTVNSDYFAVLDEMIRNNDCDLYEFSCRLTDGKTEEIRKETDAVYKDYGETVNALCEEIINRRINSLWTKVFLREKIEKSNLRFSDDINIGEDQLFIVSYALGVKSFATCENVLYNVSLLNEDSLSRKRRDDLTEQLICGHKAMFAAVFDSDINEEYRNKFNSAVTYSFYRSAYSASKEALKYGVGGKETRKMIKSSCESFMKENIPATGMKCKILSVPVKLKLTFLIEKLFRLRG